MLNQFSRTQLLYGRDVMEFFTGCRVAVFGIGGVGGYAAEALARSGIGALDLIDDDRICMTNLNRQILATRKTVGKYKVDVAEERIHEIYPDCRVRTYKTFYLPETQDQFDFREYDYVVDAIDTVTGKLAIVENAKKAGVPVISSMGAGNKLNPAAFEVADIYETSICPLARVMRRECRKRGIDSLKVVYSKEKPIRPLEDMSISCRQHCICPPGTVRKCTERRDIPGSAAFVPSVAGLIIAGEIINDLAAKAERTDNRQNTSPAPVQRQSADENRYFQQHPFKETLSGELQQKLENLKQYIAGLGSLAVGFSGGVDSSLLTAVAHEVLGDRLIAVTGADASVPEREVNEAKAFCRDRGIRHIICSVDPLKEEGYRNNSPDRCYFCKHGIFTEIRKIADEYGIEYMAEGSNMDDIGDYRPGLRAAAELSVKSPLREAGLNKSEIRIISKALGLPTWSKPAYACLASRFVYGEEITEKKLHMIDRAEQYLIEHGFFEERVRLHGNIARIEVPPADISRLASDEIRNAVFEEFKKIGFLFVTLDLKGYRLGSMNATLQGG